MIDFTRLIRLNSVVLYKCLFFIFILVVLPNTRGNESEADYHTLLYQPGSGPFKNESSSYDNPKLICFYVFTHFFKPQIMDRLCTHLNVGFFKIDEKNHSLTVTPLQRQLLPEIIQLREKNKDLKIIISIGGAKDSCFNQMIINHKTRKQFIKSFMGFIKEFKLDGIDLDWEWPVLRNGKAKEKVKFIQLLREIREEFDRHKKKYILSVDVSATPAVIEIAYYTQYIPIYVDYVNVMCYDYHFFTKLFPFTGHNSPLYSVRNFPFPENNINSSISFWLQSVPREKIVLGLPTYGHTFQLTFSKQHSLFAPAKGFGSIGSNGFATYGEICNFLRLKNTTVVYDNLSKVPYAYVFPEWVSYDDGNSLAAKVNYILQHRLGGAMVFSVNADDFDGTCSDSRTPLPLIRKVRSILFNEP